MNWADLVLLEALIMAFYVPFAALVVLPLLRRASRWRQRVLEKYS